MRTRGREGDRGASSLAVLLVGLVIVGLVVTVIVIGIVRPDKHQPTTAECEADRSALLHAEETFRTKQGHYGTELDLVEAKLLAGESSLHDVKLVADAYNIVTTGACAEVATSSSVEHVTAHLVLNSVPDTVTAGRFIEPAITVTLTDDGGGVLVDSSAGVTISLEAANGAKLSGTTTVRAVKGVATFTGLAIDKAGNGYTFVAHAAGASTATSAPVTVTAGAAAKLRFIASSGSAGPGVPFATQPVVEVEDVTGNVIVDATDPIVLAITKKTGTSGARLACDSLTVVPVAGVATFSGCLIDRPGTDYSLTATTPTLTGTSAVFPVIGAASQLEIVQQPAQTVAGDTMPPIVVAVEDSAGNVITDSNATVTVTTNRNFDALSGTTSVAVVDGVATFTDLAIATAATVYTLTMKSEGLRSTTSVVFDVTTGTPAQLVFTRQPSGGKAGKSWSTQPIVTIEDALGNAIIGTSAEITLTITPGSGAADATLVCTFNPLVATNGEARFFKCSIDRSGDYTLTANAPGMTAAVSESFSIT